MATKLFDLAVKTGEYNDQQGQKKGRWQNVGAVMQGDDGGQFIMLAKWFNPAGVADLSGKGGESILLSCFAPNAQQQAPQPQQQPGRMGQAPHQPAPRNQPAGFSNFDDQDPGF